MSIKVFFTGTLERVHISGWIKQSERYTCTTPWEQNGICRRADPEVQFCVVSKKEKTFWREMSIMKVVAAVMDYML